MAGGVTQDPLARYRAKRDFAKSGEPQGQTARKGGRRLVVQRHFARREHFDLRLEIDGVLKSWAVTRGPSANPSDKRLAVRTEDHPLEYGSFEGAIPKGEYGAGVVELWEDATYEPLNGDPAQALAKGKLEFLTMGARMRGRWALIAMKKRDKAENWLLIKERDEFAESDDSLAERFDTSVASGRRREEIERGAPSRREAGQRETRAKRDTRQGARAPTPAFTPPQLCETSEQPPQGEDWLFEMKYDGYRLELATGAEGAKAYTRTGLDWTTRFPTLARAAFELPCKNALLDGEAVVFDARGLSDFTALVAALEARDQAPIEYCAFDLLFLDGQDLRDLPLRSRKEKLRKLLEGHSGAIRYAEEIRGGGASVFAQVTTAGAEGIVAKREDARYRSGRFEDWRKIKGDKREDVQIIGYRPSKVGESFASLLAARETPEGLRYVGSIGTGYGARTREKLAPLIAEANKTKPAVSAAAKLPKDAIYLEKPFSAEARFGGWTGEGLMRQARFLGVREDRARPRKSEPARNSKALTPVTHPDRVVYPADGITKGDIAAYYERIWRRIAPHLHERVVSLVRAPDTIDNLFFQRHPLPGMNGSVLKVDCDNQTYISLNGEAGLHAAAQFGAIEIHGWMARRDDLDHPDRLVFDLDPGDDVSFILVVQAAADLRDYLAALGLRTWPMVTGGKGVHLAAPLDRSLAWPETEAFAEGFARVVAQQQRKRFVATMSKERRKGRIFIDWLRNKKKATAILPWSLRARSGAPVAAPVSWKTLASLDTGSAFNIHSAPQLPNEWDAFDNARQSISRESRELIARVLAGGARRAL
ncbi:DNA ligase D [Methylocystis bryophila]|uniref:DNA ligase (ATP) n=1 Tax=Methylocystis bryophila TaxID=655015 RepID=A0A1W6MXU8_9HYPH|nr:DNA ligase D [Methylocystis bryophila]ARN82418.1 DNA ligase D [Methylocystis bryophila]BDV38596.1 ATP-dependent DNA ligase [Methylocystis bryophila]